MWDNILDWFGGLSEEAKRILLYAGGVAVVFPAVAIFNGVSSAPWWFFRFALVISVVGAIHAFHGRIIPLIPWGRIPYAVYGLGALLGLIVLTGLVPPFNGISSWPWWIFRLILGIGMVVLTFRFRSRLSIKSQSVLYLIGELVLAYCGLEFLTVFVFLPFAAVNQLGVVLGLVISAVAIFILALAATFGVFVYRGTLAVSPGEEKTAEEAERRAGAMFRGVIGITAWEWWTAWYVVALGGQIDITTGLFLFFAGGTMAAAMIAWPELGVKGAKYVVFYSGLIGFSVGTVILLHNTLAATNIISPLPEFLKTPHNLYWFTVAMITLAVVGSTFLMEGMFGLLREGLRRAAVVVIVAVAVYWWQALLTTIGIPLAAPLPSSEIWRLLLRGALLIGIGLWWVLAFWQRGLKGFARAFADSMPVILLAVFAEWIIWENGGFTTLGRGIQAVWRR